MAIYNRLLVSAGGGVINRNQKSERENDATICIGIGGTGAEALKKLKREVYKRLKPDDVDSPVPTYKNIKYLLIDSDATKIGIQTDIGEIQKATEYFDISNGDIKAAFAAKDILNSRVEMDWLNHNNITIKEAGSGAGGIRQVGRFLLIDKAPALRTKLTSIINDVIKGVSGELNVHIFTGISGGTGSGSFVDVCYIVQYVLDSLGKAGSSRISGYLFMPDVNLSVPEVAADPLVSKYVKSNGYSALKELDYLMNLEESHGTFKQNYGSFEVNTSKPPMDLCYLISTTNTNGVAVDNGYQYGMSVAVDYVISFLSKVTLPAGVAAGAADEGQTLKGHISNLDQAKQGIIKIHGASVDYNVIGASNAEMPLSEISTYLGSRLFGRFNFYDKTPTEKEMSEFIAKYQLSYESLLGNLRKGIIYQVAFPTYDPKDLVASNRAPVEYADAWDANARGFMEQNRKSMEEPLRDYNVPDKPTSVIARIYANIYMHYAMEPDYGPAYAMRMLAGQNNTNLLHIIDGYIKKNDSNLEAEVRQDKLRRADLDNAYAQLGSSNFTNRKKRAETYLGALSNWYVHLSSIECYESMQGYLKKLREQVVDLNNSFFNVFMIVLNTLKNTFKDNENHLENGVGADNGYTWQILDIPDIKDKLDQDVDELDINQAMKDFVTRMFKNYPEWQAQDENKIALLVSDYVMDEFQTVTNKTIMDYLAIKFQTTNPSVLQQRIKEEIIQNELKSRADPLFWKSSLFNMDAVAKKSTLSVPFNSQEIVAAAKDFGNGMGVSIRKTGLTDRIFMMRFYTGVPLYAYQGLVELEKEYEANPTPGRHLYEAGEVDWREILPSPFPESYKLPNHSMKRIIARNEKIGAELDQAINLGIVYKDPATGWYAKVSNVPDPQTVIAEFGSYKNGNKIDQLKLADLIASVKKIRDTMYDAENTGKLSISTKGANQNAEKTVLRDNFLRFPAVIQQVESELVKVKAYEDALAVLASEQSEGGDEVKRMEAFYNALFTGAIEIALSKVVFKYQEYGMDEVIDLQNNKMPYAKCQVYQAYLTFTELDDSMRDRIIERGNDNMDNLTEEMLATAAKIKEKHSSGYLKACMENYAADAKRDEIKAFYQDFIKTITNFLRQYS